MHGSIVDIKSATAENRRERRKKERKKIETAAAEYNDLSYWAAIINNDRAQNRGMSFSPTPHYAGGVPSTDCPQVVTRNA